MADDGVAALMMAYADVAEERDALRAEVEELKGALEHANAGLEHSVACENALRAEVDSLRSDIKMCEACVRLKPLRDDNRALRADLDDARTQLEAHNEDLRELRADLDAARKLLEDIGDANVLSRSLNEDLYERFWAFMKPVHCQLCDVGCDCQPTAQKRGG